MRNLKRKPSVINNPKKKIKITENIENQQTTIREDNNELNIKFLLEKSIYKCSECDITCFNKIGHLMEKHKTQLTNCPHCSKSICIEDYANHFKECQNIMLFQCDFCKETFPNSEMSYSHSENCIKRGKYENRNENSPENNGKHLFNENNEKMENVNLDNNDNYSVIEQNKMSSSANINENSTKFLNSTENCEESIDINSCDKLMEQLADDILNDECNSVFQDSETITTFLKVVEKSELGKILNNEDEELLRNILPNEIESNSDNHETGEKVESGVPFFSLMKDLINPPKSPKIKHSQELIPLARKKRLFTEKEKINIEKQAKEITFTKLIAMDERKDLAIEAEIDKIMNNIDIETVIDENSMFDEKELLFDEDIYLPDEEVDKIMDICNKRNIDQINNLYENVKITKYVDPKASTSATAAQYDCHICGSFSTDQYSEFYTHLSIHNNEMCRKKQSQKRGQCLICRLIFPQIMLNNHIKTHIDHIQCNICKEFVSQDILECHIAAHSKHYSCGICGEIYKTISAVRKHYSHHLKGNTYSCNECCLVFASLEKLVRHISQDHKSIDIGYTECIYCFELTDNIKNHIYSTGLCKLKCKTCLQVFKTNEDFINHRLQHISDKEWTVAREVQMLQMYRCDNCGLMSNDYRKTKSHIHCHEIDSMYDKFVVRKPRATCRICQSIVPKNYLQNHINKHRFYDKCEICKQFVPKSNLLDHLENHETQFTCKECEEVFPDMKKLEDHQYAHYRLLQRPCNDCHLEFNSEISRVKHMSLVHKNIDSEFAECYYCKELLMVEIEHHILDANYCIRRCKLCNQRFKNVMSYKSHVLTDHRDLLENCSSK